MTANTTTVLRPHSDENWESARQSASIQRNMMYPPIMIPILGITTYFPFRIPGQSASGA